MRAHLLAFVTRLRAAGLRVSVAETIDALSAIAAAGVAREVMREALATTLVKDEADRASFDAAFDEHFPLPVPGGSDGKGRKRGPRSGGAGSDGASGQGGGEGSGGASTTPRESERAGRLPPARPTPARARAARDPARSAPAAQRAAPAAARVDAARTAAERGGAQRPRAAAAARSPSGARAEAERSPVAALARRPFADLDPDALERGRAAARELGRRFLARVSRRTRRTRRGHVDIRRTIRRAVARGGALIDLQRRGRRPGKPDLVVLCDVSGSVARASDLLLTMLAAAEAAFARVTRFVFVDRLVPIDFVDGQIRPEGELDLYALSDLGVVLGELENSAQAHIDRRTVLLVLGDGRNNRRPARADALRRIGLRARAVVWAVPEPRARWHTGDSALAAYAPWCDLVVEATSLAGLLAALRESAR